MKLTSALLFLLLAAPIAARLPDRSIRLEPYPPSAEVYLVDGQHIEFDDGYRAGSRLPTDRPIAYHHTTGGTAIFQVSARLNGFQNANFDALAGEASGRLSCVLQPNNAAIGALFWVRFHLLQVLVPLVLAGAAVGYGLKQRWSRQAAEAAIARRLAQEQEWREKAGHRSDQLVEKQVVLGQYRIVDRLGFGGMAMVYKAIPNDTLDSKELAAVKVIREEFAADEEFRRRFKRELKVYRDLNHPSIVRLYDYGTDPMYYMAMEFVEGQPLSKLIPKAGFPLQDALGYFLPALEGVAYAHDQGVIHRDIKPENVMITTSGIVKVMDFGLAKSMDTQNMTASGSILGTPAYIAPEQVMASNEMNFASDQYALGVMLYELLTGRVPFDAPDPMALVMQQVTAPPPPPSQFRADLDPQVERVVLRVLEKEPNQRFPSLASLADALRTIRDGGVWQEPARPARPAAKAVDFVPVPIDTPVGANASLDTAPSIRKAPSQGG